MSEKKRSSKISKRIYIRAEIALASPLAISGGESELTDADVMKDFDGNPFIPGSSIAGSFRGYLRKDKKTSCIFGYSDKDSGKMSSVFLSDIQLANGNVIKRDGVELDRKIVRNKYDYEAVETGTQGIMDIELVIRENSDKASEEAVNEIGALLKALDLGDIRFGAKKNRGYGWIKVISVKKAEFTKENREDWLQFLQDNKEGSAWKEWEEWKDCSVSGGESYLTITVPLRLTGGISIRRYSARPNEADYEQITVTAANGVETEKIPVIPGTSWTGAVREGARKILSQLHAKDVDKKLNVWFGYVETEKGKRTKKTDAQQSMIIFGESMLKGSVELPMTRNKINRFDASTVDGALYSELSYFGGETILQIKIRKTKDPSASKALIGLMLLVIDEIQTGYLPIGGLSSIGRGVFVANGEVKYSETISRKECMSILAQIV